MVISTYVYVFVVFMICTFALGAFMSRLVKSEGDFWVASKSLNGFVAGCSIAGTQISAGSVIGSVGLWYGIGWAWVWIWPLISVGLYLRGGTIGRRMQRLNYYTIPDYLEARFGSNVPRAIAAIVITISFIAYIGAQTMAAGYIFRTLFGWPFVWGAIFFTVIYIVLHHSRRYVCGGLHRHGTGDCHGGCFNYIGSYHSEPNRRARNVKRGGS